MGEGDQGNKGQGAQKRAHSAGAFAKDSLTGTHSVDATQIVNFYDGATSSGERQVWILQVVAGAEQGRVIKLVENKRISIGRAREADFTVPDSSCSRKHAEFYLSPDGKAFVRDLNSTNGTIVNKVKVKDDVSELNDGDRVQLGDNTVFRFARTTEQDVSVQIEVFNRANKDALTGAFNRRRFDEAIEREVSFQRRGKQSFAVLIFDVDHFKKINDTLGHPAGDEVLREIGRRVPKALRQEDFFARIGGEEFVVLIRGEDVSGVQVIAERIRHSMERNPAEFDGKSIPFTVSVGFTVVQPGAQIDKDEVVSLADQALYTSKESGRNRVTSKLPA
ncbi:MAG TPA: GGDEF domain-containing protein [Bdellovibrionota bacterium]|jgi:diguanylate cyclase (GGDEF)-like protein|nr:GGDEF domain-containing protein [Bdellovibrionota bacterium]